MVSRASAGLILIFSFFGAILAAPLRAEEPGPFSVLQFLDGSTLRGHLRGVEAGRALLWEHPDALQPLSLNPANIDSIRFRTPPVLGTTQTAARFRFTNGDEIFGKLVSLDEDRVQIDSSFEQGGRITAPRQSMEMIQFLTAGSSVLYDGPNGLQGWTVGGGARGWRHNDGAFVAEGIGTIGRKIGLSGSSRVEFDLAWTGSFNLVVILYTDVVERIDYGSSCYMLYISPHTVTLQRVQPGASTMNVDQAQVLGLMKKPKINFEIRANKEEATWSILIDGMLLFEKRDHAGFAGKGTGICFASQRDGSRIELSNLKISEWDWKSEEETGQAVPGEDWVFLANRDRVAGSVRGIRDGQLLFVSNPSELEIPLPRVTRIQFGTTRTQSPENPWAVRAQLFSGEHISLELENWSDHEISGVNENFGPVAFSPRSVRQLQFNLNLPRRAAERQFPFGEPDWDFE